MLLVTVVAALQKPETILLVDDAQTLPEVMAPGESGLIKNLGSETIRGLTAYTEDIESRPNADGMPSDERQTVRIHALFTPPWLPASQADLSRGLAYTNQSIDLPPGQVARYSHGGEGVGVLQWRDGAGAEVEVTVEEPSDH